MSTREQPSDHTKHQVGAGVRVLARHTHQGIAQHVPDSDRNLPRATVTGIDIQRIRRKPVLNGLINEYWHAV